MYWTLTLGRYIFGLMNLFPSCFPTIIIETWDQTTTTASYFEQIHDKDEMQPVSQFSKLSVKFPDKI